MPPKKKSTTKTISTKLWQEAYKAILTDPDEYEAFAKFSKVVSEKQGSIPDLTSEDGRVKLNKTVEKLVTKMESSSSPKTKEVFSKLQMFRGLIAAGASANPGATVAVAGLFIAFDFILMHQAEEAAISEMIVKISDISYRNELLHHFIESQPHEHAELQDARSELKAAFVQLKRTTLLLTMKLAYKLNSWHSFFLTLGSWGNRLQILKDAETRVTDYIRDINIHLLSPPARGPNWTDTQIPRLHRLVRDGRTDDIYDLIDTGKCPPAVLNEQTSTGWTALMFAARDGQYKILTYLLRCEKIEVNKKNADGNTALILAAQSNRPIHIARLIEAGAKLNLRNKMKRTAWLQAARAGKLNAMKKLSEKGDDVDQVTGKNGWCALHTAVYNDDPGMVVWLLEVGAKRDIKIDSGKSKGLTPRELALKLKKEKALKVLSI